MRRLRFSGLSMTGHLRTPRTEKKSEMKPVDETRVEASRSQSEGDPLRQKLRALGSSFASLGQQVDQDARRRRELASHRCQELLVALGKLEHELTDETHNRDKELAELRQAMEKRLAQMVETIQSRLSDRFASLLSTLEALAERCATLEFGIQQFRGERPSQLQVEMSNLRQMMLGLHEDLAKEQPLAAEQAALLLQQIEEGDFNIDAELQKELVRLERRGEALQELIDQFVTTPEDADIGQKRALVLQRLAALRAGLAEEVAKRDQADDEVVQAINAYTAHLIKSFSKGPTEMFPYACHGALQALPRGSDEAPVVLRSAAGREGPAHAVSCCRRGRAHAVLAASAAAITLWRRQPRSKSLRPLGLCAQGDGEYMEEFDALGRELSGKAVIVGWDPGPKKRAASAAYGPSFSPEESLEELENLCGTLGVEVKERVLQQWRPTSGRMPIGSGKADELRQQEMLLLVREDMMLAIVMFERAALRRTPVDKRKQRYCSGSKGAVWLTSGGAVSGHGDRDIFQRDMAGDVRQPSPMLWLHPVHLCSADPKPLRLQPDPSCDSPLRGELLSRLLDRIAGSDFASPRPSDTRDCPVTLNNRQLQVKSDILDEPLFCISLMLADVVSTPASDLETAQGDLALQVIAVAPRAPEAELDSSRAGPDEAWILCSAASDTLVQLSMQGAVRWDWKDTFSTRHVLGTGSCGKVFAAAPKSEMLLPERLRGQDGCAVKVLSGRIDQTSLRSEALSLAMAAGHPNICGFAGVFCEVVESDPSSDGSPKSGEGSEAAKPEEFKHGGPLSWRIVLELLPGGDLFDSVSDHGVLQEAEAMELLLDTLGHWTVEGLLSALAHLHSLRLVHRDVKAENVLFGRNRHAASAIVWVSFSGFACAVVFVAQIGGN
ncbi:unnamed protein product [Symbiodinium necroappetens]|uniref:Protein kinase domain-containing protein n=1 Tax=Symbiodinium necroappetens TaxID=1628268 RepID=A0A812Y1K2_9DINO|nr:unnamed protein product [Symbiodinium necroappetens]